MNSSRRLVPLCALLTSIALTSAGCTTQPVRAVCLQPLPPPPEPAPRAECTKAGYALYPKALTSLPPWFGSVPWGDQQRALLSLKAKDGLTYHNLLDQAQGCAK